MSAEITDFLDWFAGLVNKTSYTEAEKTELHLEILNLLGVKHEVT